MVSLLKSEHSVFGRGGIVENKVSISPTILLIFLSLLVRFLCIGSNDLLVEEAYYWNYSQHLDFSYLDHPPMVALLIKVSTLIFGTNEFSIRFPALFCWGLAALFSFKLTELVSRGSGKYAVLLLSILPFYFIQSVVTTPDQPVLACWSAALYYFYRIFLFDESNAWYKAGVCLGLGMLSKYTIVLLGPAVLLYMITIPSARYWFLRKEPYLCVVIALFLFTPVIYWNATHEWVSFIFQSTRRFHSSNHFSFHYFICLVFLYLLPGGVIGLWMLWNKKTWNTIDINIKTRRFIQIFTLFPLAFFGVYSLSHAIKIDWIGPGLISIIPWLALLIAKRSTFYKAWHVGALFLLSGYFILILMITLGPSATASRILFQKMISWENMTEQVYDVAKKVELERNTTPIIAPLDAYNIGSELAFYQEKLMEQGKVKNVYPIIGRHIFGKGSLMYEYWSDGVKLSGKILILISPKLKAFDLPSIRAQAIILSPPQKLWSHSQGRGVPVVPYYYELVQMK
jgi:dolichol-phosphate mannosyltransferase